LGEFISYKDGGEEEEVDYQEMKEGEKSRDLMR